MEHALVRSRQQQLGIGDDQPVTVSQQKIGSVGNATVVVTNARSLYVRWKQHSGFRLWFKRDEIRRIMFRPLNVYLPIQDKQADV